MVAVASRLVKQVAAISVSSLIAVAGLTTSAVAQVNTFIPVQYSYQRYNNWCGSASLQMVLSAPEVRNNNAFVNFMLNAPDDPGRPANQPQLLPTLGASPFGNNVTRNPQAFIYGLNHGTNTVNNQTYLNPFLPFGRGSDMLGTATALNLLDNRNFPGGVPQGNHAYAAWNFAPGPAGSALATRQIANSLFATGVPAMTGVNSGAHFITVNGVTTSANPIANTNYNVTGVFVNDPWTGYVDQQVAAGFPNPGGGRGLGTNAWIPNGYDIIPGAPLINVPGVGLVPGRFKKWSQVFNTTPAFPGQGPVFAVPGTQFVTATASLPRNVQNIPLEVGGPQGNFFGLQGRQALPQPLAPNNFAAAIAAAQAAIANNAGLVALPNFNPANGNFNLNNARFLPDPNPIVVGDGNFLLPFNDFNGNLIGSITLDALTGDIDLSVFSSGLADFLNFNSVLAINEDLINGTLPESGGIPTPGAAGLLVLSGVVAFRRRRNA